MQWYRVIRGPQLASTLAPLKEATAIGSSALYSSPFVALFNRYTEYELRPGGADIAIDSGNCAAYVAAVVDATLGSGIARQVSFEFPTCDRE